MADHIPPPTPEQFRLLERELMRPYIGGHSIESMEAHRDHMDAVRAVLAYARFGAETAHHLDEAGILHDARKGIRKHWLGSTRLIHYVLSSMGEIGLLSPPAHEAERRSGGEPTCP